MRPSQPDRRLPRRGVTLLEMLVAVALLILMMTVVTSIFQAATGAITVAKTYQELDGELRQLDSVIRQDLQGATVDTGNGPITPPIDPDLNLGYLEIGEGQFADLQSEDSDDYIRLTVKAPEGQPFTGRMWVGPIFLNPPANTIANQPVMIQSQVAEVIYFLRNGNLYRRVFLVAPERQSALTIGGAGGAANWQYPVAAFGGVLGSWQGMNDLSARPSGNPLVSVVPLLNTLGDLTNRENRAFSPRFCNDYVNFTSGPAALGPDGQWDDVNPAAGTYPGDSVPDWWPTLYPNVFGSSLIGPTQVFARLPNTKSNADYADLMAFPYVFPGAYSVEDPTNIAPQHDGNLHGMGPLGGTGAPMAQGQAIANPFPAPYGNIYNNGAIVATSRGTNTISQPNHNPIPTGDTLSTPDFPSAVPTALQTWWGFPTWKETMSPSWADPVFALPTGSGTQATGLSWVSRATGLLPPLTDPTVDLQQYNDGAGTATFATPTAVFRDDVIMQGVRSFDIKVFDNAVPGYVDLGYSNFYDGAPSAAVAAALLQTMGHEGRIPPLTADFRSDPNYPNWLPNIGDNATGVIRLRRVWDSWSTDYSNAPATGLDLVGATPYPMAGPPLSQPVYPSYPAPYPVPLRGLQIQIRVVDPRNERIKMLTIRHTFSG